MLLLQLQVRTRSVGTNTQEPGKACDTPTHMGPCQPGTSVNLEGIVWHETEEGEQQFTCLVLKYFDVVDIVDPHKNMICYLRLIRPNIHQNQS